jgi:succinate dehydrogenase / fumarate reductase membrane anchor subunit
VSLQSPLGRVLGLGSAGEGTGHFVAQRVSSVALLLLGIWFLYRMFTLDSFAFLDVVRFIGDPLNGVLLVLLALTSAHHSWLGVQVVIEDYVHAPLLKTLSLISARFAHVFFAVAAVYAILIVGLQRL